MAQQSDVREVLQYIPQFRGKIFLVLIEAGLLPEPAVAETLLDLAVLEDLGSKNGTTLRSVPVLKPVPLRSGDEFTCGQLQFRYLETAAIPATQTQVRVPPPGTVPPRAR